MANETAIAPYGGRVAVHEEVIEGFGSVRILPLEPDADADVVHGWVREPRAEFWGMNGLTKEQVQEIYAHLATLDTHHAFLAVHEGEPGDIGVHVLLAPAGPGGGRPGPAWSASVLAAFTSYVLVGLDPRRVVVDPDVRNEKAIARFMRQGFERGPVVVLPENDLPDVYLPDVYLPEKRAQLAFLRRGSVRGR
ncbi:GNAT family N-acetyltransferase [Streptomyces capitiformicae]|uniref:Lysine N-acyltransferase MbtK n=1 Tax=Streptomyces capitiformicae TaxID=2014920 RepID=A0A919GFG7_9ACTN|nr:GNAT family N-acetyltransferase [Streptomyces capitiformicae]GHH82981.1 acetyltransferase [Streptomyces capitiformicae]